MIKNIIQNEQQGNSARSIILVGGFFESEVVKYRFSEQNIKILFDGGLVVFKGGTIYRFDSSINHDPSEIDALYIHVFLHPYIIIFLLFDVTPGN